MVWGEGVSAELNSLGAGGVNKSFNSMVSKIKTPKRLTSYPSFALNERYHNFFFFLYHVFAVFNE